jgi:hypothetical protein
MTKKNGVEMLKLEESLPLAEPTAPAMTPVELLRIAVTQGADIEKLSKLMDLQERWEKSEARKAFVVAMNKFKADPPTITKNKHVHFQTAKGATDYDHATLDHVCDEVTVALSRVGITHAWRMRQDVNVITVVCVLTHELGHSEETALYGNPDDSGGKNTIQAIGSTVSYLQRYTLLAACGLAASNDTDGRSANAPKVDEDKMEEFCRQMSECYELKQLQTVFAKAYADAQALSDRSAMARYIQIKDLKKKELANAAS